MQCRFAMVKIYGLFSQTILSSILPCRVLSQYKRPCFYFGHILTVPVFWAGATWLVTLYILLMIVNISNENISLHFKLDLKVMPYTCSYI